MFLTLISNQEKVIFFENGFLTKRPIPRTLYLAKIVKQALGGTDPYLYHFISMYHSTNSYWKSYFHNSINPRTIDIFLSNSVYGLPHSHKNSFNYPKDIPSEVQFKCFDCVSIHLLQITCSIEKRVLPQRIYCMLSKRYRNSLWTGQGLLSH